MGLCLPPCPSLGRLSHVLSLSQATPGSGELVWLGFGSGHKSLGSRAGRFHVTVVSYRAGEGQAGVTANQALFSSWFRRSHVSDGVGASAGPLGGPRQVAAQQGAGKGGRGRILDEAREPSGPTWPSHQGLLESGLPLPGIALGLPPTAPPQQLYTEGYPQHRSPGGLLQSHQIHSHGPHLRSKGHHREQAWSTPWGPQTPPPLRLWVSREKSPGLASPPRLLDRMSPSGSAEA